MKKLVLISILFFSSFSFANIDDEIYVDPTKIDLDLSPGESKDLDVYVYNIGKRDLKDYRVEIMEFVVNSEYKIDPNPKTKNPLSLVGYSKILNDVEFGISKQSKRLIKIQVSVPKDYEKGSGYLIYKVFKKPSKKVNFVGFMKEIIGIVKVNVKDRGISKVKLTPESLNRNVNVSIENIGDKLLNLNGKIIITKNNLVIGNIPLLEKITQQDHALVFPNTKKNMILVVPPNIKGKKNEKIEATVLLTDSKNGFSYSEKINLKLND